MGKVFTMLLADTFIYAILVWYIESIHPGTYGIPRPWYFPFQLSYWFGPQASLDCEMDCFKKSYKMAGHSEQNTAALLAVETEPRHLKLGVAIENLLKVCLFLFCLFFCFLVFILSTRNSEVLSGS